MDKIKIEPEALQDIQQAIDWYNQQKSGLGRKFYKTLEKHIELLKSNPFFQVRYDKVRCLPVKKYPFMIHYTLDEKSAVLVIRAVLSTHRNPEIWEQRKP